MQSSNLSSRVKGHLPARRSSLRPPPLPFRSSSSMGEDNAIDQDALARLEALQRQRMMDMFGYDPDEELGRKRKAEAERRKVKAAEASKEKPPDDGGKISRCDSNRPFLSVHDCDNLFTSYRWGSWTAFHPRGSSLESLMLSSLNPPPEQAQEEEDQARPRSDFFFEQRPGAGRGESPWCSG